MMQQSLRMCRTLARRHAAAAAGPWPRAGAWCHCGFKSSRRYNSRVISVTAQATTAPPPPAPESAERSELASRAVPATIYSRPELYDAAFSYRDFKTEVRFLQDVQKNHGASQQLTSVLELGCGGARHLANLAKAGVPKVVGLDMSPDMLTFARANVAKLGARAQAVELLEGDMASFDLSHKSFDMVVCLLGTFSHILDTQQAISCFRRVSEHLRPGGLFVLEMAHPGDLFDGTLITGESGKEVWEQPYNGGKIFVEWGDSLDNFDPVTQILYRTVTISVFRGDEVVDSVDEVIAQRQYTVRELELLAGMTGFETQALYGEMQLNVDLEHEDAYRLVAVYKKV
ncbi:hypothetical protein Vretimale_1894 [Volvox reticuliferus]|uniref:Uncharacterized protein n=1 Tax=Volvox reticuliferus TaxID=1737510 RepID=A0A8J4CTJ2_9CHLO|nr:hypothetical protein Vretifemale_17373 [Volvox reticuliferus]GIL95981.1 hypothetical protein Vretimale_1894 [Volvox reticuliferus]